MSRLAQPTSSLSSGDRMSAAEFRVLQSQSSAKKSKGRNGKFNAIAITSSEGRFDSKMEYQRYLILKLMQRAGEISDLQRQVRYELAAGGINICTYVADFVYKNKDATVVEDSKGFITPEYRLKRRLMKDILGIEILETGRVRKPKKASQ
jgi:hypothetical protein